MPKVGDFASTCPRRNNARRTGICCAQDPCSVFFRDVLADYFYRGAQEVGSSELQGLVSCPGCSDFRCVSLCPLGWADTAFSFVHGILVSVLHSVDAGISANSLAAGISIYRIGGISSLLVLSSDDVCIPDMFDLQVSAGVYSLEFASESSDVWIGDWAEHVSGGCVY